MKMIDLGQWWYVNPGTITYVRPYSGIGHENKSEIKFASDRYVYTATSPQEIAARKAAADSDLEGAVKGLIDLSKKNESLLASANARVKELTDRLALFEAELRALKEVKLPLAQ